MAMRSGSHLHSARRAAARIGRSRSATQAVIDASAWILGLGFAAMLRLDFHLEAVDWAGLAVIAPLAALSQLVGGMAVGLYIGRWVFGSFEEMLAVGKAAGLAGVLIFVLDVLISRWFVRPVPLSVTVGGAVAALVLMASARYAWRLVLEARRRPDEASAARMLVFGAGQGGSQLVTAMLRNPDSAYLPVALLDDDPSKRNLRIMGTPVVGGRGELQAAAAAYAAQVLLIAIPSASAEVVGQIDELATSAGLDVKVLPPVGELLGSRVGVGDIRDVTVADLLGRHEIETDVEAIAGYLTGKRVLVTGAGGSIGSELCRQIYRFAPAQLVMLDRDESALHGVQLSIEGRALLDSPNLALCDIRDEAWLRELFAIHRPQVVFHAAALKHLPLLEQHPSEAVKSNVVGTLSVLQAAAATGVERFVNISSDKAADPGSVLGYSKRIGERLTTWFGEQGEAVYLSVRFGNVLASRGSVVETFRVQIEAGGPLTITHPDVTRYFMTIPEAVGLVIQAGAIGRSGEALVLDMGNPVRILDVAKRLAAQAARPVKIHFTGLRAGEKLHEVRLGEGEADRRPVHPLISHVRVPALRPDVAVALGREAADAVVTSLRSLCAPVASTTSPTADRWPPQAQV